MSITPLLFRLLILVPDSDCTLVGVTAVVRLGTELARSFLLGTQARRCFPQLPRLWKAAVQPSHWWFFSPSASWRGLQGIPSP